MPDRAADVLGRLLDRYLGGRDSSLAHWLVARLDTEVAVRIGDLGVSSWDFASRMGPDTPSR